MLTQKFDKNSYIQMLVFQTKIFYHLKKDKMESIAQVLIEGQFSFLTKDGMMFYR